MAGCESLCSCDHALTFPLTATHAHQFASREHSIRRVRVPWFEFLARLAGMNCLEAIAPYWPCEGSGAQAVAAVVAALQGQAGRDPHTDVPTQAEPFTLTWARKGCTRRRRKLRYGIHADWCWCGGAWGGCGTVSSLISIVNPSRSLMWPRFAADPCLASSCIAICMCVLYVARPARREMRGDTLAVLRCFTTFSDCLPLRATHSLTDPPDSNEAVAAMRALTALAFQQGLFPSDVTIR